MRVGLQVNNFTWPTGQARPTFSAVNQYLLARGYAIFDLNFRGSTGYGKRFTRLDNQRLRPNAVKDMQAAVDWLRKSRPVDASRVAVMGGSYGGYMTTWIIGHTKRFKAALSERGVNSLTSMFGSSDVGWIFSNQFGGHMWDDMDAYLAMSPM